MTGSNPSSQCMSTVSEVMQILKTRGYDKEASPKEKCIEIDSKEFALDDVNVDEVYRFEGNSDPSDESSVYALSTTDTPPVKAVMVMGYGAYSDSLSPEFLKFLQNDKEA